MKKIITLVFTGVATLFFTACGGVETEEESVATPIEVNLIGTWDYSLFTTNSTCDGLLSQGIKIVESMNGDTSKMGNTLIQGTEFDLDANQQCYLTSIDKVSTNTYAQPSIMTSTEYKSGLINSIAGDNTIKSITVDSFNNSKIQKTISYTSSVIITEIMTR